MAMACYGVARIAWAANRFSPILQGRKNIGCCVMMPSSLLSSYSRTQIHSTRLLPPSHNFRYKSTATSRGKSYNFMTKHRVGVGSLSALCGHASSIFIVFAYCHTDMLGLRCLAMSSEIFSIAFQYYQTQPLWIPIGWSFVFLCVNGFMVTQLLLEEQKADKMSPQLQKIYDNGKFDERGFSKVQFVKFFEEGRRVVFVKNEMITQEGRKMNKLYYILDGEATVKRKKDGRKLATVSPHCFIGELSFLVYVQDLKRDESKSTPQHASATVYADNTVHLQEWDFGKLSEMLMTDRDLSNAFASYCSHDLRNKLLSANNTECSLLLR